jgi:manganese/zinc/iron transport system permease protein
MSMIYELIYMCLTEYTIRVVLMGGVILGATAGILGTFVLVRQQSLLGDAIAHASLPGIVGMFLLTGTIHPVLLMIGGLVSGVGGILFMHCLLSMTRLKKDAILGIILSVFFGVGLVLLTVVQKQGMSDQAVLNKYLFGSVATLLYAHVIFMFGVAASVLAILFLIRKECTMMAFDPDYARVTGYPVGVLEGILNLLLVLIIGVGLHMVGVILMSTMIIAPAAAARQWTSSMSHMMCVAGFFGAAAAVIGIVASSMVPHMPTGPCMVVAASGIVGISLLLAPERGVCARWARRET